MEGTEMWRLYLALCSVPEYVFICGVTAAALRVLSILTARGQTGVWSIQAHNTGLK